MSLFDQLLVAAYLLVILVLGVLAGRKNKDLEGYSVAGRGYGTFVIFATLSASFIGGGFTIGNSEKVFTAGIVSIVALFGFSLKEIIVALVIAPRMADFGDAISVGDIMDKAYGRSARIISGVLGLFLCAGIVGAQTGAMGHVFKVFLGISPELGIVIGCTIVILYSTAGGMRAVVLTDVIQFLVLGLGIPLACFIGIEYAGGWSHIRSSVPESHLSLLGTGSLLALVSLFLTFLFGETLVPPYVQRLLIGKDAHHTERGTLLSGIFSVPFFCITGLIGLVALTLKPDLDANQALPYVISVVLPVGLKGLVVAGIISVVMSSADSFLNSASIAFTRDILCPLKKEKLGEKQLLKIAKLTTLVVGILSVIFPLTITSVMDCLLYAYNFWAPVMVIPLGAAFLGKKASARVFLFSAAAGISANLIWFYVLDNPFEIDGLIVGVLSNFVVFSLLYNRE